MPVIDLAAHRRARSTPATPLRPGPADFPATIARLVEDYYLAAANSPDDVRAHLWAMLQVLSDVAGADRPREEARYLVAAVTAELNRALGGRCHA